MPVEILDKPSSSTVRKPAPRYRVLLHNDDVTPMEYVVQALMKTVASLTQPQAVNIMMGSSSQWHSFGDYLRLRTCRVLL